MTWRLRDTSRTRTRQIEWERQEVTGDVPEPRLGAALGMIDGDVFVVGGCNKQQPPR